MIFHLFLLNQPNKGVQRTMFLVVIFFNDFSLFVPIFDLVHAVDAILIPLKQLRASQNRL